MAPAVSTATTSTAATATAWVSAGMSLSDVTGTPTEGATMGAAGDEATAGAATGAAAGSSSTAFLLMPKRGMSLAEAEEAGIAARRAARPRAVADRRDTTCLSSDDAASQRTAATDCRTACC
ncbi:unnamed protein product [Closterium sp. NIES-54]